MNPNKLAWDPKVRGLDGRGWSEDESLHWNSNSSCHLLLKTFSGNKKGWAIFNARIPSIAILTSALMSILMTGSPAWDALGMISWLHFASCGKKKLLVSPCCSIQYRGVCVCVCRLASCILFIVTHSILGHAHKRRHTMDLVLSYGLPDRKKLNCSCHFKF